MTPLSPSGLPAASSPPTTRRRRALGLVGAVGAAGLAVLWTAVVPDKADTTTGVQAALIRWGHPASWALLSGLGLAVTVGAPKAVRDPLAWAALGSYLAFLAALAL